MRIVSRKHLIGCVTMFLCGLALAAAGLWLMPGGLSWHISLLALGGLVVAASLVCITLVLGLKGVERYCRELKANSWQHYRQLEALLSLHHLIKLRAPLPPMRWAAISPDSVRTIMSLIMRDQPRLIVEAGSGVSTLIMSYCLERIGAGRIVALEHDEDYANVTRDNLQQHQLARYAEVVHAPLVEHQLCGKSATWYDVSRAQLNERKIDFLLIDGPPAAEPYARYPALPLLHKQLSERAVVVLDDYNRDAERRIVDLWLQEFPDFRLQVIDTEHGLAVMWRQVSAL